MNRILDLTQEPTCGDQRTVCAMLAPITASVPTLIEATGTIGIGGHIATALLAGRADHADGIHVKESTIALAREDASGLTRVSVMVLGVVPIAHSCKSIPHGKLKLMVVMAMVSTWR